MNFIDIENFDTIDSTNDRAIYQIENNLIKNDKILIARSQTNGHGLNGKSFISDRDVGIYFTFIHFYDNLSDLNFITQKAAVAIYETFKNIFNIELSIKWVNDLYYKNKKVAGILCRNIIKNRAVIVGVGIDLFYNQNLNSDLKDIAGFIFKDIDELIFTLNKNTNLSKDSILYKSILNSFNKNLLCEISTDKMWIPNDLVVNIVENLYKHFEVLGIPSIYIEKNIIKDERIYEDCVVEC